MRGIVEKVDLTKTGKAYRVRIGDGWYNAQKRTGVDQMLGKTVEYDAKSDPTYGTWIENLKVIQEASPAPANTSVGAPGGDRFYMPFTSNVVAHAIQAGLIKEPEDISKWAKAAYDTAQALDTM